MTSQWPEHMGAQFLRQRPDALFQRLALKRERQFGPRGVGGFRDAPGNRAIIRDAEDDSAHPAHDAGGHAA